jgi:hypothetical protein
MCVCVCVRARDTLLYRFAVEQKQRHESATLESEVDLQVFETSRLWNL